jgi:hypothetical protein
MIAWIFPILAGYLLLFAANGIWNGWVNAYDINLAITSPWDSGVGISLPWLAFPLSIAGWSIVPILAGAVVGYSVNSSLSRRRAREGRPAERSTRRSPQVGGDHDVRRDPPFLVIPSLRDRSVTTYFDINNEFVDYFVGLHDGDWGVAEDHFAREVKYLLVNSDAVQPHDRQGDAMRLAVSAAVAVLLEMQVQDHDEGSSETDFKPSSGHCEYCARGQRLDGG